jgi:NAD(P)-dependent dehydrogenase (short-subunit alcohol dehydrogenase family)
MREFKDRVAVVTGAASGIGFATARRFAAEGMKVVLADVEEKALARATEELRAEGASVLAVPTDVSKADSVEGLARRTLDAYGAVHVIFNNAGVFTGGMAWEQSLEDWQWVLGVNVWGVVHGIRSFVPIMLEQGTEGWVISTASGAGLVSLPGSAPYNVSKHAVVTLSESLHQELRLRKTQIGVSVLCPGAVNTAIPDGDRNRPPELRSGAGDAGVGPVLREFLKTGMDPAQVGDIVFEGIRDEKFYLFTDPEGTLAGVRKRFEDILEQRAPRPARLDTGQRD